MRSSVRRRARHLWLWVGFSLAAVATGWAVHGLYDAVRREVDEQSKRVLQQEMDKAAARIRAYADEVRLSIIAELAAFHVDGLNQALRRWDDTNDVITGTFQWEASQGFHSASVIPADVARAGDLPLLWEDFRNRHGNSGAESEAARLLIAGYHTMEVSLLDNPDFPADELGYQAENLDILSYAGRTVDPWAGWGGHVDDAAVPWVFWYQAGPDAPVRGCFADVRLVVSQLRSELGDPRLAQIELTNGDTVEGDVALTDSFPAHALRASTGVMFQEKQGSARFAAVTVALLLGVFLVGVALLANLSRREARDAERKSTFVSQVSHELRTPITSIRMFADMLGAPAVAEEKRIRFAATISRESQRLGALIERLLTFAALQRGMPEAPRVAVDVAAVVRETIDDMEATLQAAGMRAEVILPSDATIVTTDPSALKQALLNLVDNAVKYARDGGLVRISLSLSSDLVRVRVSDLGPGIAGSLPPRLFEPFVQGRQSLTDRSPGVGLGLSIARGLLRAAGGDLVLVSSAGGATFEIRLPNVPSS